MTGRNGKDIFIKVPLGTIVSEKLPGEAEEADMVTYPNIAQFISSIDIPSRRRPMRWAILSIIMRLYPRL